MAGKLGLTLAFVHPSASPTGIALAEFLLLGYRLWPAVFVGAFLVNVTTAGSVATSLGIAAGNTLEGLLGAYLVNRFAAGRHAFRRPFDVLKFAGLAGLLSRSVSPTLGVTSLGLGGYAAWSEYWSIWFTWWLGDVVSALVLAPTVVLWGDRPRVRWPRGRIREFALALAFLALTAAVVFGGAFGRGYPLEFLCVVPLVWVAVRLGTPITALADVLLAGVAVAGTLQGFGPFADASTSTSLLFLKAFMTVPAVMAMAVAASGTEHRRFNQRLHRSEEQQRAIAALTSDFAVISRLLPDGTLASESATDGFTLVTGYALAELRDRKDWARLIDPADRTGVAAALGQLRVGRDVTGDPRIITKSGERRRVRFFARPFSNSGHARALRILIAVQDITDWRRAEDELAKRQEVIRALSTPVLRLDDRLLLLPVVGDVDPERARQLTQQLMAAIRRHRARAVVLDLTGVGDVTLDAANHLPATVALARLLGATTILSGISAQTAHQLVSTGVKLHTLTTAGDLQAGLDAARRALEQDLDATEAREPTDNESPEPHG